MTSSEMLAADRGIAVTTTVATHDPRDLDILCGKETKARNHKGSKCFRIFVDRYRKRYQEANNKHKRGEITKEMYLTISQANIRFLKFNDELNGWVEISSKEARDKITHALRFAQNRSSRKNKKNVPQRQGSDSTHRSETSATSATSYDWDQLLLTQQHLAGLSLGNMSSSLRASRSSFSSTGSASLLSRDTCLSKDSSHSSVNNRKRSSVSSSKSNKSSKSKSKSKVSFEPSVGSAGLSTIYSASTKKSNSSKKSSAATKESATLESIPLPVELSSTQHLDMHQSQTNLDSNGTTDRPPRMPSRPTEEDEQPEEADREFDTIMNTTQGGFEMLDPLLELEQENMRDSDSGGEDNNDNSNGDGDTAQRIRPNTNLSLEPIGTINEDDVLGAADDDDIGMLMDNLGADLADMGMEDSKRERLPPVAEGEILPNDDIGDPTIFAREGLFHPIDPATNCVGGGDYSQLLMQEPLWEWEEGKINLQEGNYNR